MAKRPSREIIADALDEMAELSRELRRVLRKSEALDTLPDRVTAQIDEKLGPLAVKLDQAIDVIRDLADGQNEHRGHVRDQMDRLGTRVHELERRAQNGGE